MFERFTDRARRVVVLAQEEARQLDHSYVGTEHILLGLVHEGEGVAAKVLEQMGIELDRVRRSVEQRVGRGGGAPQGQVPFTPRAKKVLELSLREALALGHNYIGTEHLLLGLIREGEGEAAQVLIAFGIDASSVRDTVMGMLTGGSTKPVPAEHVGEPPTCPGCGESLEARLGTKDLATTSDNPSGLLTVRLIYCKSCGRALGVLPA